MSYAPISFVAGQYEGFEDYWLKCFEQGTTTPKTMATDATGGTTASKFELNSDGFFRTAGAVIVIPHINGAYDAWLFPTSAEADANDTSNAVMIADNITPIPPSIVGERVRRYDNVADLISSTTLAVGNKAWLAGYDSENDGGHGWYNIVAAGTGTDDSGSFIDLTGSPTCQAQAIFDRVINVKRFGAKGDGTTNDLAAIDAADLFAASNASALYFPKGTYKVTGLFTKNLGVSWISDGIGKAAQSPSQPAAIIEVDGPTSGTLLNIDGATTGVGEANFKISGISFVASGASKDLIACIESKIKIFRVENCSFTDFTSGVKLSNVEQWCVGNYFSSCTTCIDSSAGENHILDNHGFPQLGGTGILIRSNNTIVKGNKFFGDGGDADYGMRIWGFGNIVEGNVFDAFIEAGILLDAKNTAPFTASNPQNRDNKIIGNSLYGNGNVGDASGTGNVGTYNVGILITADAHDPIGNIISCNTFANIRTDRAMNHCIYLDAKARSIDNTNISNNSFSEYVTKAIGTSGTMVDNRVKDNHGYITEKDGSVSGYNALSVSHGLDVTPTHVSLTTEDATVIAAADSYTSSTFRLLMKDNAGTAVSSGSPVTVKWKATKNEIS
jgi:hypothetical protein